MAPLLVLLVAVAAAPPPVPTVGHPAPGGAPTPALSLPREAAAALRSLGGRVVGNEARIVLVADTLFDPGAGGLRSDAGQTLERVARVIRALPDAAVTVTSHCDPMSGESAAIALTVRQGQAVAAWLTGLGGLGPRWIAVRGLGATEPLAAESRGDGSADLAGRRRNRRIEVVVRQR